MREAWPGIVVIYNQCTGLKLLFPFEYILFYCRGRYFICIGSIYFHDMVITIYFFKTLPVIFKKYKTHIRYTSNINVARSSKGATYCHTNKKLTAALSVLILGILASGFPILQMSSFYFTMNIKIANGKNPDSNIPTTSVDFFFYP